MSQFQRSPFGSFFGPGARMASPTMIQRPGTDQGGAFTPFASGTRLGGFPGGSGGFYGSQALEGLAGQVRGQGIGAGAFRAFLEDYQKTNQALQQNYQRMLPVEQQLQQFVQGLPGQAQQFGEELQQVAGEQGQQVMDTATANLAQLQDFMDTRYGEAKGYFDTGLAKFEEGIEEYGQNQAALWSSQALAAQQGFQNSMTEIASNPNLTPEMKAAQTAQLKQGMMQQTQAMIAPQQARLEEVRLQAKQSLAGLYQAAGGALGQLGQGYAGLLQAGQGAVQRASEFVAGLKTQAKLQAQQVNLQSFQLQMSGFGALANVIKSNPLMFASAGPVALAAANLAQMGGAYNPFRGQSGIRPDVFLPTEMVPHTPGYWRTQDVPYMGRGQLRGLFNVPQQSFSYTPGA